MFRKIKSLFTSEATLRRDISVYVDHEYRAEDREAVITRLLAEARR